MGDACTLNNGMIDTPRGFPRVCSAGKWVPLCDGVISNTDVRELCESYGLLNKGETIK